MLRLPISYSLNDYSRDLLTFWKIVSYVISVNSKNEIKVTKNDVILISYTRSQLFYSTKFLSNFLITVQFL